MAVREISRRKPPVAGILVILICIASLLLVFSFLQSSEPAVSPRPEDRADLPGSSKWESSGEGRSCNYSEGSWVRDSNPSLARYDNSCKEIFKGWNCISAGKSNAREIASWRWQPFGCNLPPLDPSRFLNRYRNSKIGTISQFFLLPATLSLYHFSEFFSQISFSLSSVSSAGFVGDSLNRNMFVSLVCMLRRSASGEVKKLRPAGADRGFNFVDYNLTVAYHRTNLLVRYTR